VPHLAMHTCACFQKSPRGGGGNDFLFVFFCFFRGFIYKQRNICTYAIIYSHCQLLTGKTLLPLSTFASTSTQCSALHVCMDTLALSILTSSFAATLQQFLATAWSSWLSNLHWLPNTLNTDPSPVAGAWQNRVSN